MAEKCTSVTAVETQTAYVHVQINHTLYYLAHSVLKVQLSLSVIKSYVIKAEKRVEVQLHAYLTSALHGCEWLASRPGPFIPGKIVAGTHRIGGWMGS